eukprot:CAMPEP_0170169810 /NCGR_PEP_ID=MMETSP0040_2-20121228/2735_1 /TAXON_ID=641309 /ORGANISM="Lotharella oceanica, Strain CCMP622" /LENGTH=120 /DNA_ID=CAMNT_0010408785 /DNA_START=72 /DNA_END=434 /DNA_ORIENTATION=-
MSVAVMVVITIIVSSRTRPTDENKDNKIDKEEWAKMCQAFGDSLTAGATEAAIDSMGGLMKCAMFAYCCCLCTLGLSCYGPACYVYCCLLGRTKENMKKKILGYNARKSGEATDRTPLKA